ncbi:MAG: hypothetical protein C0483_06065 [Pirellula sp.]|nr:hypothetical protein [Pirellula sp.]
MVFVWRSSLVLSTDDYMLRDEDIRIDIGRSSAGNFMRMVHVPSGIERMHPGPLRDVNQQALRSRWKYEIEVELLISRRKRALSPAT